MGSPVSSKITPSSLIESTDIPAGEPGGYGYDETVSTPVEEMGNVDEVLKFVEMHLRGAYGE